MSGTSVLTWEPRVPKVWFTSDRHFWHHKAAKFRGFSSVTEMNAALIKAHNDRVAPDDTVYDLGDFSFAGTSKTIEVLEQLNGRIHLVPGNHDDGKINKRVAAYFAKIMPPLVYLRMQYDVPVELEPNDVLDPDAPITLEDVKPTTFVTKPLRIVLCHFPILSWRNAHNGAIHLHGHSHGSLRFPNPSARIMDVGVDCNEGFAPVSLSEVLAYMQGADYKPFDQHEEPNELD